ncbi:MepB family protein [Aquimarina sp. 2-A2]|uniref:MepB family protein n=1 Tax=Aquimarina sp. 2-A2 TaxID=3382644 RepID=UPI00387F1EB0
MKKELSNMTKEVYERCGFEISNLKTEDESREYEACQFELNSLKVISRNAKTTPKKIGQFVTFWKRSTTGPIEPFHATDHFDFYVVNVNAKDACGQFVFPKSVLIKKGIVTCEEKEGKRGFRVYPSWDTPTSAQALRTQQWQLNYFFVLNENNWLERAKALYEL